MTGTGATLSRRSFLTISAAAGGLLLGFPFSPAGRGLAAGEAGSVAIGAWISIAPDNTITLIVANSEMGQGVTTSLPMVLAEELDADWSNVRFAMAPADPAYAMPKSKRQFTGAARSAQERFPQLRRAGAAARAMLVEAAARRWGVAPAACVTQAGSVRHPDSGRSLTYGDLAAEAALLSPPEDPPLKPWSAFTLVGTSPARLDLPAKADGSAVFGIDVKLPGLLHAAVRHAPTLGQSTIAPPATSESLAADPILQRPGVRAVVPVVNGVAVVADTWWQAQQAAEALTVEFTGGIDLDSATVEALMAAGLDQAGLRSRDDGDVEAAEAAAGAGGVITADYAAPLLHHACMEPPNCTVHLTADRCDVWIPTQEQERCRQQAADFTGLPLDKVAIHTTLLGGGLGRRYERAELAEALAVATAVKAPVKLLWTREDDIKHGYYRPPAALRLRAALGADGMPVSLSVRAATPSLLKQSFPQSLDKRGGVDHTSLYGLTSIAYGIPNLRVEFVLREVPFLLGFLRSVSYGPDVFAVESFLDEIAARSGLDPLAVRRRLLANHPRGRHLLDVVAERSGWGGTVPPGRARGIAFHEIDETYVAQVAEVGVVGGEPKVYKVWAAVDCGRVIHPDIVRQQMEGSIVFGLSNALREKITLAAGAVEQSNFYDYTVAGVTDVPEMDITLVDSAEPPSGIGEAGVPGIQAALGNALAVLTGERARRLPLVA